MEMLVQKLFKERFQQTIITHISLKYQYLHSFMKNSCNYTKLALKMRDYKHIIYELIKEWKFDKDFIRQVYLKIRKNNNTGTKQKAIKMLYDNYITQNQLYHPKYCSYQLIQYLLSISNDQFVNEFGIHNNDVLDDFIEFLKQDEVNSLHELKMRANISKHIEHRHIEIYFNHRFTANDITDDVVISMMYNIENRLQYVRGKYEKYFVVLHRVSDHKVLKSMLYNNNKLEIEKMFQDCNDSQLYDVIIYTNQKYDNLGNLRIRSLSYTGANSQLTLKHPKDLVSLSAYRVRITNLKECINLTNLQSDHNVYTKQDFQNMQHIKRIHSSNDTYQNSQNCLVQDLFANNKLEYVIAVNDYPRKKVVGPTIVSQNISNLRYLHGEHTQESSEFTIDATNEQPQSLYYFHVETPYRHGELKGPDNIVNQLYKMFI